MKIFPFSLHFCLLIAWKFSSFACGKHEIWLGNSICQQVNPAFAYPLLLVEPLAFGEKYQRIVEEAFSVHWPENAFHQGMRVIAALVGMPNGFFCRLLREREIFPSSASDDDCSSRESVLYSRKFVKEFFVETHMIGRIVDLFIGNDDAVDFKLGNFELLENVDFLGIFSSSAEHGDSYSRTMKEHLREMLLEKHLEIYVQSWSLWMQIVKPQELGIWSVFGKALVEAVPGNLLFSIYQSIEWNPLEELDDEEKLLESYVRFFQLEMETLAGKVSSFGSSKTQMREAFQWNDDQGSRKFDFESFAVALASSASRIVIPRNLILFAASKARIPFERWKSTFESILPFVGCASEVDTFALWMEFLRHLPEFPLEELELTPTKYVANRCACIEAKLKECEEFFPLCQRMYQKPWLGLCKTKSSWISPPILLFSAFKMIPLAKKAQEMFSCSLSEFVACLHSPHSKRLLLNLLLAEEEKLDHIPDSAEESLSLMLEIGFCSRVFSFIQQAVKNDLNMFLGALSEGSFYSFSNDLHEFFECVLQEYLHVSPESEEYGICFYHTCISREKHTKIVGLLERKETLICLLQEMRKKSLLQTIVKANSPSFHRIVHYSVPRRAIITVISQEVEIWEIALWTWKAFYIQGKPFTRLFDTWSSIGKVEDEFVMELIKHRIVIGEFLMKLHEIFANLSQKESVYRLLFQIACETALSQAKEQSNNEKNPRFSLINWFKKPSNNNNIGNHGNSPFSLNCPSSSSHQPVNPISFVVFCQSESLKASFLEALLSKMSQVFDATSESQVLLALAFLNPKGLMMKSQSGGGKVNVV